MTRTFIPLGQVTAVVLTLGALSSCGGGDKAAPETKPAASKTPPSALPKELMGAWTRTFSKREVGTSGDIPAGRYTLKIREGMFELYEGPKADPTQDCISQEQCAQVELKGSGNVLTVGETPTCTGVGRYAFVVKGDTLRTKKVQDDCRSGRPLALDNRTWKRAD